MKPYQHKLDLEQNGYAIIPSLFEEDELIQITALLNQLQEEEDGLQISAASVFAKRKLLKELPALGPLIFNQKVGKLLSVLFQSNCFLSKAIYFDKPADSNWFVAYHQDLSISVKERFFIEGYTNWTYKKGQFGVQPPEKILRETVTLRIHLDDTDRSNGALRVFKGSHKQGIIRLDSADTAHGEEVICEVNRGGAMLMKPLTLHASGRSIGEMPKRVIHLEFNSLPLDYPLRWLEYQKVYSEGLRSY